jgi:hypothetical protein
MRFRGEPGLVGIGLRLLGGMLRLFGRDARPFSGLVRHQDALRFRVHGVSP